jgi:hypothetical protein
MAKPLRLPGIEEQRVLDELGISLLLDSDAQERWNQLVVEGHYLSIDNRSQSVPVSDSVKIAVKPGRKK